ncbi:MAG TPA: hypothetical protein VFK30_08750 [Anaerolineae bacterium]|nr:hypothetical protein [Anaerolineae bacterium]
MTFWMGTQDTVMRAREEVAAMINAAELIEPEETIKQLLGQAIMEALDVMDPEREVIVVAYGNQASTNRDILNTFSVSITTR